MEIFPHKPTKETLLLTDSFYFLCHSELSCFNSCCRNKHLPLTPYDVLRLKRGLNLHSDDFLSRYTLYRIDENSGFPVISLKMENTGDKPCPFVSDSGCLVYANRPSACRLYPLGRASRITENGTPEAFFFRLDTPNCLGIKEETQWKVTDWIENQGLGPYLEWNDKMGPILFHPKREKGKPLSQGQIQKIIVACYNLDVFREFVFKTEFLTKVEIDNNLVSKAEQDDEPLLEIGLIYLHRFLF